MSINRAVGFGLWSRVKRVHLEKDPYHCAERTRSRVPDATSIEAAVFSFLETLGTNSSVLQYMHTGIRSLCSRSYDLYSKPGKQLSNDRE